jgi:replicative superfamily II helicase
MANREWNVRRALKALTDKIKDVLDQLVFKMQRNKYINETVLQQTLADMSNVDIAQEIDYASHASSTMDIMISLLKEEQKRRTMTERVSISSLSRM